MCVWGGGGGAEREGRGVRCEGGQKIGKEREGRGLKGVDARSHAY